MRSRLRGAGVARGRLRAPAHLVVLGGALLVAATGCYWAKYDKLARTHAALLVAMVTKIEDVTARDGIPPASLTEYRYPVERARDFARIAARRYEGRASLTELRLLCDEYDRVLAAAEALRADAQRPGSSSSPDPSTLAAAAAAVRARAAALVATLDREAGRSSF